MGQFQGLGIGMTLTILHAGLIHVRPRVLFLGHLLCQPVPLLTQEDHLSLERRVVAAGTRSEWAWVGLLQHERAVGAFESTLPDDDSRYRLKLVMDVSEMDVLFGGAQEEMAREREERRKRAERARQDTERMLEQAKREVQQHKERMRDMRRDREPPEWHATLCL